MQYTIGLATAVPVTFISVGEDNTDGELDGFLDIINFLNAEIAPPQVLTTRYVDEHFVVSSELIYVTVQLRLR